MLAPKGAQQDSLITVENARKRTRPFVGTEVYQAILLRFGNSTERMSRKREKNMSHNDMTVSHQWASRPNDQRFLSLASLHAHVARREELADEQTIAMNEVDINEDGNNPGGILVDSPSGPLVPTNWSFGQLCTRIGAPAEYMSKLSPGLVAANLNFGLQNALIPEDSEDDYVDTKFLVETENEISTLRAVNSASYGRIYDKQVVEQVLKMNGDGRWKVPEASYQNSDPLRATTLYASDRDVFIFLVDPDHPVESGPEHLFRGFYVWNSEVGSKTFGIAMFLYRYVCDNRIIWGQKDYRQIKIRHTKGGPGRFLEEASPVLQSYAESSTKLLEAQIKKARSLSIGKNDDEVVKYLVERKFGKKQSRAIVEMAIREEGSAGSVWNVVQGATALARELSHTDKRMVLEAKASELLSIVED